MNAPAAGAAAAWAIAGTAALTTARHARQANAQRAARLQRMAARPSAPPPSERRRQRRLSWTPKPAVRRWLAPAILAILGWVATRSWTGVGSGAAGGLIAAWLAEQWRRERRRRRILTAVPELLRGIAGGLRAGSSLRHVLQFLSSQSREPLASLLTEALSRERLGYALDQVFQDLGRQHRVPPLVWLGTAVAIQRQTGGSLAQMVDALAEALANQERIRREVRALTAQGRTSALVLALLVPGLTALVDLTDPRYLAPLFGTAFGRLLVAYAVCSTVLGLWVVSRMVRRV